MTAARPPSTTASPTPPEPSAPSDGSLVLRNLRLLDLHCLADWPNLSIHTFTRAPNSPRDKERISAGEWVLYRLFEIWDRRLTATTLASFFPPLVPLQSINLRAALYRGLSDLKRDGVLGRETILRKTTLDECRGEKFIELLLTFSTAVLRKRTLEQYGSLPASDALRRGAVPAAVERPLSLLQPLIISYRCSLQAHLRTKSEANVRFKSLEAQLHTKESLIRDRKGAARKALEDLQHTSKALNIDILETQSLVQDEFPEGDPWLDLMLNVNSDNGRDDYLEAGFDTIWTASQDGRPPEIKPVKIDLLSDLQSRISQQSTRLQEWRAFQNQLSSRVQQLSQTPRRTPKASAFTSPPKSTARSPRKSPYKTTPSGRKPLQPLAMESAERLAQVTQPTSPSKTLPRPVTTPVQNHGADTGRPRSISPRKPLSVAMGSPTRTSPRNPVSAAPSSPTKGSPQKPLSAVKSSSITESQPSANESQSEETTSSNIPTHTTTTEGLLSGALNKMTLTERAQATLGQSQRALRPELAPQPEITTSSLLALENTNASTMASTLAERARESMAYAQRITIPTSTSHAIPNIPPSPYKLPAQPASPATPQASTNMLDDDDCASIFKSRPKLKTSPVGSLASSPVPWRIQ